VGVCTRPVHLWSFHATCRSPLCWWSLHLHAAFATQCCHCCLTACAGSHAGAWQSSHPRSISPRACHQLQAALWRGLAAAAWVLLALVCELRRRTLQPRRLEPCSSVLSSVVANQTMYQHSLDGGANSERGPHTLSNWLLVWRLRRLRTLPHAVVCIPHPGTTLPARTSSRHCKRQRVQESGTAPLLMDACHRRCLDACATDAPSTACSPDPRQRQGAVVQHARAGGMTCDLAHAQAHMMPPRCPRLLINKCLAPPTNLLCTRM
jgi:hypothetical protein